MPALDELVILNADTGETVTLTTDVVAHERFRAQTVACFNYRLPQWATADTTDIEVIAAYADGSIECAFDVAHHTTETFISTPDSTYDATGVYRVYWDTNP